MPYRDDYDALANRCSKLERELSQSRAELERSNRARSLPLLDQIRVASPCQASWEAMEGDDQVRFCLQCSKNVYDLSGMTREAAERLVQETEGAICVRFYRRADGTVLTADCPVGARKLRFRRAVIAAVGAGILALGAAWAVAAQPARVVTGGRRAAPPRPMTPPPKTVRLADPAAVFPQLHKIMGGPVAMPRK
jgi:hypothetical protein